MIKISSRVESSKVSKAQLKKNSNIEAGFADFLLQELDGDLLEVSQLGSANLFSPLSFLEGADYKSADFVAKEKGKEILESLEDLKRNILLGNFEKDSLVNIKNTIANQDWHDVSFELRQVLQEIEQRVAVELAKNNFKLTEK